jgi:hypothetical protein
MERKDWTTTTSLSSVSSASSPSFSNTSLTITLAVFGSAQLKGHKYLRPKAIHDAEILEEFSKDYMYLSYVRYINSVHLSLSYLPLPFLADFARFRRSKPLPSAGTLLCSTTSPASRRGTRSTKAC